MDPPGHFSFSIIFSSYFFLVSLFLFLSLSHFFFFLREFLSNLIYGERQRDEGWKNGGRGWGNSPLLARDLNSNSFYEVVQQDRYVCVYLCMWERETETSTRVTTVEILSGACCLSEKQRWRCPVVLVAWC